MMPNALSEEPQQGTTYILRPDTVVELPDTENTYNRFVRIYDRLGQYITDLDLEAFNRGFVEFDEDATRKQIFEDKELFRIASLIGCDGEDWQIERRKNNLVDYVFSLITGVTLGRKQ